MAKTNIGKYFRPRILKAAFSICKAKEQPNYKDFILATEQWLIEALERLIQTTTGLKRAIMHKLLTKGFPRPSCGGDGPPVNELMTGKTCVSNLDIHPDPTS